MHFKTSSCPARCCSTHMPPVQGAGFLHSSTCRTGRQQGPAAHHAGDALGVGCAAKAERLLHALREGRPLLQQPQKHRQGHVSNDSVPGNIMLAPSPCMPARMAQALLLVQRSKKRKPSQVPSIPTR